jgi:hypothetical protein
VTRFPLTCLITPQPDKSSIGFRNFPADFELVPDMQALQGLRFRDIS